MKEGGLKKLFEITRRLQDADPELKSPRLKQYDNATGIEIIIE